MTVVTSACPSCGRVTERETYDIGSGPELSCADCEWCWGAEGQPLRPVPMIVCPRCGAVSAHPDDIRESYCGRCHDWTRLPAGQ